MTRSAFFLGIGLSQWPLIDHRTLLQIQKIPSENLKPGDLVVFKIGCKSVCHRILRIRLCGNQREFLLKGDNNAWPDGWMGAGAIAGKVIKVGKRATDDLSFRVVSWFLFQHSRFQYLVFETFFLSPMGHGAKIWWRRLFRFSLSKILTRLFLPWKLLPFWKAKAGFLPPKKSKLYLRGIRVQRGRDSK